MSLLLFIVIGAIAGWIASLITRSPRGIIMDIILGIVGAFIGGLLMNAFGYPGVTGFDLWSVLVAILGAVIVVYIARLF